MYSITRILKPLLLSLLGATLALSLGAAFWYRTALAEMVINAWQGYKLTDGLVGYWSFDAGDIDWTQNKAFDRSGQGNHGVFTNMATATAPVIGKTGQGISFDGGNDYVQSGNTSSLQIGTGTISAWIKTSGAGASYRAIVTKEFAYGMYLKANVFMIYDWGASLDRSTGVNVADGEWHHVAVQFGSGTANGTILYIDGVARLTTTMTVSNQGDFLSIGDSPGQGQQFNGLIDEARVYNRALSAEEVKRLYLMGGSFKVNTSRPYEVAEGLLGSWTFDAQDIDWSLNKAFDRSGQGNNGTFTNMATTTAPVIGKNGQAINFDGTNDFLDAGDIAAIDSVTELTVCAWVKPGSISDDDAIVSKENVGVGQGSLLFRDDVGITSGRNDIYSFVVFDSADTDTVRIESPANTTIIGQWVHLCGTYVANSASGLRLYMDGVGVADNPVSTGGILSIDGGTGVFRVGSRSDGTMPLPGTIDDVRVYNRALSAEEVKRLYLMGGSFKINTQKNTYQTDSLAALWSFDAQDVNWSQNKALDRSSGANHGVFVNMSTTTAPTFGKIGQGIVFDKVDDYINLGTDAYQYANDFTFSAWVNTTGATADEQSIISTWGGRSQFRLETNATAGFYVLNGGDLLFYGATSTVPFTSGEWHHLAAVKSSSGVGVRLYVDGVLAGTNSYTGNVAYVSGETHIGGRVYSGGENDNYFSGTIDDVRVYNRALSAEEVKRLYLIGK